MKPGDRVIVTASPDNELHRIVLEVHDGYVLVCRPEVYLLHAPAHPPFELTMGFPKEDVRL